MLHKVYLYGELGDKYGKEFNFDINSVPQAVSALVCNFKTFRQDFQEGYYRVLVANDNTRIELDEDSLNFNLGQDKEIHIIPVPAGSKNSGATMKIVAGLALLIPFAGAAISAAMFTAASGVAVSSAAIAGTTAFTVAGVSVSVGALASVGLSLLVGGISQALTKAPKIEQATTYDKNASFIFNGPINKTQQGTPIPIVYGRFRTGSVVISSGMQIEQLL